MTLELAIIDYGMGNLRSVQKAIEHLGSTAVITEEAGVIEKAPGVILPGVGAFGDAVAGLKSTGLWSVAKARAQEASAGGRPFLGICLGMQILMDSSEESPGVEGLGCFAGGCEVLKPGSEELKVPQMGWNELVFPNGSSALFDGIHSPAYVYFVHSFEVKPADFTVVSAQTVYGKPVTAALCRGNLHATQFHPEKSQVVGLKMLQNFLDLLHVPH